MSETAHEPQTLAAELAEVADALAAENARLRDNLARHAETKTSLEAYLAAARLRLEEQQGEIRGLRLALQQIVGTWEAYNHDPRAIGYEMIRDIADHARAALAGKAAP